MLPTESRNDLKMLNDSRIDVNLRIPVLHFGHQFHKAFLIERQNRLLFSQEQGAPKE